MKSFLTLIIRENICIFWGKLFVQICILDFFFLPKYGVIIMNKKCVFWEQDRP